MNPVDLRLYGIIDPEHTGGRNPVDLVREAVAGGTTLIQYRDKKADGRRFVELARELKNALAGTGVPLLINDRVDVALAANVDGVHLGQDDIHPADARALLGTKAMIGLTIQTSDHAASAKGMPVDYTCIGAVFATTSKHNVSPPIGIDGFREIEAHLRRVSKAPVGAIAGINASNTETIIAAGADGIAVISALFMSAEPRAEAQRLRRLVDQAMTSRGVPA